jgi:hypothetical protein
VVERKRERKEKKERQKQEKLRGMYEGELTEIICRI